MVAQTPTLFKCSKLRVHIHLAENKLAAIAIKLAVIKR